MGGQRWAQAKISKHAFSSMTGLFLSLSWHTLFLIMAKNQIGVSLMLLSNSHCHLNDEFWKWTMLQNCGSKQFPRPICVHTRKYCGLWTKHIIVNQTGKQDQSALGMGNWWSILTWLNVLIWNFILYASYHSTNLWKLANALVQVW